MLSDNQLITAVTGVFSLNREAKVMGLKLVAAPRSSNDDALDLNHRYDVIRRGAETGFYVQIGMGEVSLDFFDGDASHEIASLEKNGFATPVMTFVEKIVDTIKAMEKAA